MRDPPKYEQQSDTVRTLEFLRVFLQAYPLRSVWMIALLALSGLAEGFGVVSIMPVLDLAGGGGPPQSGPGRMVVGFLAAVGLPANLTVLLGLIVVAISLKSLLLWLGMRAVGYAAASVTADFRLRLLNALLVARWSYFQGQSKGELANALGSESQRASAAFLRACGMFANFVLVVVYGIAVLSISKLAAVFALIAGAMFFVAFRKFIRMSRESGKHQTDLMKSMSGRLVDVIGSLKAIKAMGLQEHVFPVLASEIDGFRKAQRLQVSATQGLAAAQEPALTFFLAGGILLMVQAGASLSSVLVLGFMVYRILGIGANVQRSLQDVVIGESAFWSLSALMDRLQTNAESVGDGRHPATFERGIVFKDVWFTYDGADKPVLCGLSMEVPKGSFTALVGESGVGKTTVADLIMSLHEPDEGQILIDDTPLSELNVMEWRRQIGYVPQDPFLLHDTIRNNITFGDESVSEEDLIQALKDAEAWDFVSNRSDGMDTVVGEQGAKLSGGQRQRVAIARALVRRPKILILDEATTGLDPETERGICQTLQKLKGRLTILAISHQPALRDIADVVYRLVATHAVRGENSRTSPAQGELPRNEA